MGKLPRLYLDPSAFQNDFVSLDKESSHYLKRVLRLRPGDAFCAMDGKGKAWLCSLLDESQGRLLEPFLGVEEPSLKLTVAVALCKGERFENTIEKLAELGTTRLVPLHTERTERKEPSQSKRERWQEISKSASALAYRLTPMEVDKPVHLTEFLQTQANPMVFCHPGGAHPIETFSPSRCELTLVIGPEGGFSQSEAVLLGSTGNQVDLGPFNLRVETAALLAAGLALRLTSIPDTDSV